MHILLVSSLYPPRVLGGAELAVRELADGLVRAGEQVTVLTLRPPDAAVRESMPDVAATIIEWPLEPWVFDSSWRSAPAGARLRFHLAEMNRPASARRMRDLLDELAPDVVHTHNLSGFGTAVWTPVRQPLVHTAHDYWLLCPRTAMYRGTSQCSRPCLDCRLATWPRLHARRKPDLFVAVSGHVLQAHRAAGFVQPTDCATVVPSARAIDVPARELRGLHRIGYMGRLEAAKGLPVLLDSIASAPFRDDVRVIVAGRGTESELAALDAWRAKGVAIDYLGYASPKEFLDQVDCVCVPTQWAEPFGRVAAEARSANLPVLASRTGGLVDVLAGYDGGVLVEEFTDPRAWSAALLDARTRLANRRIGVSRNAAPSDSALSYVDFYRRLRERADPGR